MHHITPGLLEAIDSSRLRFTQGATSARILAMLMEIPCPARCKNELGSSHFKQVEPYYLERHEFIRRLLVDVLLSRLRETGVEASMVGESRTRFGHGDIDVFAGEGTLEPDGGRLCIRIEVKGGSNFSISQVFRHLLDVDAVVVCLGGAGAAFAITRKQAAELLTLMEEVYTKKLGAIGAEKAEKISGPWCEGCRVECTYAQHERTYPLNYEEAFESSMDQWRKAICQAVDLVILLSSGSRPV